MKSSQRPQDGKTIFQSREEEVVMAMVMGRTEEAPQPGRRPKAWVLLLLIV